tara:strand:- start:3077 stop:3322 length:246 start_codon:yes stop_codon:yes gene_type:complete
MKNVAFQRRHFNWMVGLMVEMDLSEEQTDWMIMRLSETNDNFNERTFRLSLMRELNARETTSLFSSPLTYKGLGLRTKEEE